MLSQSLGGSGLGAAAYALGVLAERLGDRLGAGMTERLDPINVLEAGEGVF